jgi:hypothetical protein
MTTETITLGGREFELAPMPWAKLKRLTAAINRVGQALAAGVADDETMDEMGSVLSIGLGLPLDELEALPTNWHEASNAFRALMRVSGMEQEMEFALGEAQRRGFLAKSPAGNASTPGTSSTPASSLPPDGAGKTATP